MLNVPAVSISSQVGRVGVPRWGGHVQGGRGALPRIPPVRTSQVVAGVGCVLAPAPARSPIPLPLRCQRRALPPRHLRRQRLAPLEAAIWVWQAAAAGVRGNGHHRRSPARHGTAAGSAAGGGQAPSGRAEHLTCAISLTDPQAINVFSGQAVAPSPLISATAASRTRCPCAAARSAQRSRPCCAALWRPALLQAAAGASGAALARLLAVGAIRRLWASRVLGCSGATVPCADDAPALEAARGGASCRLAAAARCTRAALRRQSKPAGPSSAAAGGLSSSPAALPVACSTDTSLPPAASDGSVLLVCSSSVAAAQLLPPPCATAATWGCESPPSSTTMPATKASRRGVAPAGAVELVPSVCVRQQQLTASSQRSHRSTAVNSHSPAETVPSSMSLPAVKGRGVAVPAAAPAAIPGWAACCNRAVRWRHTAAAPPAAAREVTACCSASASTFALHPASFRTTPSTTARRRKARASRWKSAQLSGGGAEACAAGRPCPAPWWRCGSLPPAPTSCWSSSCSRCLPLTAPCII